MKKIFFILSIVVSSIDLVADEVKPVGGPYTEIINGVEWTFSIGTDLNAGIAGVSNVSGSVTIPTMLGGRTVTDIKSKAFYYCRLLSDVTIPSCVTNIGNRAFHYCDKLTDVTIVSKTTNIGSEAFRDCVSLANVTITNGVVKIGNNAFFCCSALTNVLMATTVTSIGTYAFYKCNRLKSVAIPTGISCIQYGTFYNCSGMLQTLISEGVYSIDTYSFYYCIGLTNIALPSSLTNICEKAFYKCYHLSSITIPAKVQNIGASAFSECSALNAIDFAGAPPTGIAKAGIKKDAAIRYNIAYSAEWESVAKSCKWTNTTPYYPEPKAEGGPYVETINGIEWPYTVDGNLNAHLGTGLTSDPILSKSTSGDISIPEVLGGRAVVSICDYAFNNCYRLTGVAIPKCVANIGKYAFAECTGLSNMTIPEGVTNIDAYAFWFCSHLGKVSIPSTVLSIGCEAFRGCTALSSLSMADGLTGICDHAFWDCRSLQSVQLPASVASIGDAAFACCSELTAFTVAAESEYYSANDGVLFNADKTSIIAFPAGKNGDYEIPLSVTNIGNYAFYGCENISHVKLPNGVSRVGDAAFCCCYNLAVVQIPGSVTSLGRYAFCGCKVSDVEIPEGVRFLEDYVFSSCNSLTNVLISSSVTNIGNGAFSDCHRLQDVNIEPENRCYVTEDCVLFNIDKTELIQCLQCKQGSYVIPSSVTNVCDHSFSGCTNLSSLTLPLCLKRIGRLAFSNCSGLTKLTIFQGVTHVGEYAFSSCSSLGAIDFTGAPPDGILKAGVKKDASIRYNVEYENDWKTVISACGWTSVSAYRPPLPDGGPYTSDVDGVQWMFMVTNSVASIGTGLQNGSAISTSTVGNVSVPSMLSASPVKRISDYAFSDCNNLISITIPSSVTYISGRAFYNCRGLQTINVESANAGYISRNGILFNSKISMLVRYPSGKIGSFEMPTTVTEISNYAFSGCSGLENVVIADNVKKIGKFAFENCNSIESVTIPFNVTSMGDGVFAGCALLNVVDFEGPPPDGILTACINPNATIRYNAKYQDEWQVVIDACGWTNATSYYPRPKCEGGPYTEIDNGITWSFSVDAELNATLVGLAPRSTVGKVVIPKVLGGRIVKSIGQSALCKCECLTNVVIQDSVVNIGYYAFEDCEKLAKITIPTSVTNLGSRAFYGCDLLEEVSIPESVESIGDETFSCSGLKCVEVPTGVKKIGHDCWATSKMRFFVRAK